MGGTWILHEKMKKAFKILVGKPRRCRRRWKGNIKTDLSKLVLEDAEWIYLT
jgi:hypothetical protein